MSHPSSIASLEALNNFSLEKILNEDPFTHALTFLGNVPAPDNEEATVKAIIRIEKTALNSEEAPRFFGHKGLIKKAELEESTDIVRPTMLLLLRSVLIVVLRSMPGYLDGLEMKGATMSRSTLFVLQLMFTFVK